MPAFPISLAFLHARGSRSDVVSILVSVGVLSDAVLAVRQGVVPAQGFSPLLQGPGAARRNPLHQHSHSSCLEHVQEAWRCARLPDLQAEQDAEQRLMCPGWGQRGRLSQPWTAQPWTAQPWVLVIRNTLSLYAECSVSYKRYTTDARNRTDGSCPKYQ